MLETKEPIINYILWFDSMYTLEKIMEIHLIAHITQMLEEFKSLPIF